MAEDTQSWHVGGVRVTSVVESQTDHIPPPFFFPEASEAVITSLDWLRPGYADEEGRLSLRVQALVVEAGGRTILVDPCDDAQDHRIHADSVAPILDAGLADVVTADADLGDGLRLQPTAGHTPGHTALWIESAAGRAVLVGDIIHHPLQCSEPEIAFVGDADPAEALATRVALLKEVADAGAVIIPAHFPSQPAGRLEPAGAGWRFRPEAGRTAL